MRKIDGAVAATRYGLGAREGEIAEASTDPRGWLAAQLSRRGDALSESRDLPSSKEAMVTVLATIEQARTGKDRDGDFDANVIKRELRGHVRLYANEILARTRHAATTPDSFRERLVRFWSNHFTVSGTKPILLGAVGAFEREAIRPHVTASFTDMLLAVEQHPAMLIYLDNAQSIGPNSRVGRRRGRGLNENLAREILELHTLGVSGGYTQADIEELARAITGWTVGNRQIGQDKIGEPFFAALLHEPGSRRVLGRTYPEDGRGQGIAILRDLAVHPSTARHLATKLARHFVADDPPDPAIRTIERAFLDTQGDLRAVSDAVISLDLAWSNAGSKFKNPEELMISTARGLDTPFDDPAALRETYQALGQAPFRAPAPQGWSDAAMDWAGPDPIRKRLEWANQVAIHKGSRDARSFVQSALGPLVGNDTSIAIARAASGSQALILALMSPEFQRR